MDIKIFLFWAFIIFFVVLALAIIFFPLQSRVRNISTSKIGLLAIILFPVGSLALYLFLGSSGELMNSLQQEKQRAVLQHIKTELGSPDQVIEKMKAHLAHDPNSARGWFLLGRLYASMQQLNNALDAFTKADHLQPHDPQNLMQLAQTHNLLAIKAYGEHHYDIAILHWQKIIETYPNDVQAKKILTSAIENAKAAQLELPVRVSIAPTLKSTLSGKETLFVYAKEATGSPIPLAVMRYPLQALPMDVVLTGAMSMDSSHRLKKGLAVVIVARISKSGQAMPEAGDLQGTSHIFKVGNQKGKVVLVINHPVEGHVS